MAEPGGHTSCFNSVLYGAALKHTVHLLRVQLQSRGESVLSPSIVFQALLKQLHHLLLDWRIQFKLTTFTFKALHTGSGGPPYVADLLQHHQPRRSQHSSSSHQLSFVATKIILFDTT